MTLMIMVNQLLFASDNDKRPELYRILSNHGVRIKIVDTSSIYILWKITSPKMDVSDLCNMVNDLGRAGVWVNVSEQCQ